jgi:hypothetical protein
MTMTMNGAYFNGLDQNGLAVALANIPGSVTTDYILFSLEVPSGTSADINFGLSPIVLAAGGHVTPATDKLLCSVVRAGVAKGKCQRVWLSIGSGGSSAFTNIQTILNTGGTLKTTLLQNFGAICQALKNITGVKAVGFDMDYEEGGNELATVVANVTIALYKEFQCQVTFCPYQQRWQDKWIAALQQVYSTLKIQPVVGYNLQTYSGGNGNDPTQWTTTIANAPNTGVSDPASFVWPIVSCDSTATPVSTPQQVVQKLRGWRSKGASLWAAASLSNPPSSPTQLTDYGEAIFRGIQGS